MKSTLLTKLLPRLAVLAGLSLVAYLCLFNHIHIPALMRWDEAWLAVNAAEMNEKKSDLLHTDALVITCLDRYQEDIVARFELDTIMMRSYFVRNYPGDWRCLACRIKARK